MVTIPAKQLAFTLVWVILLLGLFPAHTYPQTEATVPAKCKKETNPKLGFLPRAITLTAVNVRTQMPEYSLLKERWILGQPLDVLPANTCLEILDKKVVGVIQI